MYKIYDNDSGELGGELTLPEMMFLFNHLETESTEDRDFYINRDTVDYFESAGADAKLVSLLRELLGDRDDMEIRWVKQ